MDCEICWCKSTCARSGGYLSYRRTDFIGRKRTIIQNEQDTQQFPLGGVGEIESGVSLSDTDGDGMPDEFEDGYGLDKNNPDDASQMAENGYTNIENYIFTLDERLDK